MQIHARRWLAVLLAMCAVAACSTTSAPGEDTAGSVTREDCAETTHSTPRIWIEVTLAAIRADRPEPTVHARNLFHLSAAMWNVWAEVNGGTTVAMADGDRSPANAPADLADEIDVALSHAAHTIVSDRYVLEGELADAASEALAAACTTGDDGGPAAQHGRAVGQAVLAATADDGAARDADDVAYTPVNPPLRLDANGTELVDPNRWQPLFLEAALTRNGLPEPAGPQVFFAAHWGRVEGFALPAADPVTGMPIDPGPPPLLDSPTEDDFHTGLHVTLEHSRALEVGREDLNLSPSAHGNRPTGSYDGPGHPINPATGDPYPDNIVDRGDYGRIIAEYWADGPDSETPPGHWNVLAIDVGDDLEARGELTVGSAEELVDRREFDVKLFLSLNGALHDAAIAAWGAKAHYDYVRPISAIRHLGSPETGSPAQGMQLVDGLVELITAESVGERGAHRHLSDHVGELAVPGWLGQPDPPGSRVAGVEWVPAGSWIPYQRPTFVTPAFAAYVSGHSTFSRAAAEVLTNFTGSAFFPGGIEEHEVRPGGLTHEQGPSRPVTLQWATYRDAADEAGRSRLYGGIHVPADDVAGRLLGETVGTAAWERAEQLFSPRP